MHQYGFYHEWRILLFHIIFRIIRVVTESTTYYDLRTLIIFSFETEVSY